MQAIRERLLIKLDVVKDSVGTIALPSGVSVDGPRYGTVVSVGSKVDELKAEDRVAVSQYVVAHADTFERYGRTFISVYSIDIMFKESV